MRNPRKTQVATDLDQADYDLLVKLAKENERSVAAEVRRAVKLHLKRSVEAAVAA